MFAANKTAKKVAVIGAGWAGCAAALTLAQARHHVTLCEASRTLGGRAREVEINGMRLDNGQHIMLGAYASCLSVMRQAGLKPEEHFLRLPLQMPYPPGQGMQFIAPDFPWPAPLHLAIALWRAQGLSGADKMALARFSTSARWMGWQLHTDCSVAELLMRFEQTPNLIKLMWRPLCLAALNTPPERASSQVFLAVLRDSLGAKRRAASDMLLPKSDLSSILPVACAERIRTLGGQVHTACTINALSRSENGWQLQTRNDADSPLQAQTFDAVILATPAATSAKLLQEHGVTLPAFEYEAITTCYLQYDASVKLARPMYALIDDEHSQQWGQFVFDRGQLHSDQAGLLAVIISAADAAAQLPHEALSQHIAAQLATVLKMPALAQPQWSQIITEKRATFACNVGLGLTRPDNAVNLPGVFLAGDYTKGEYPATLEGAVRSGMLAAQLVKQSA
ncbi:MAG: FAD-dependent oxidoreductase [Burkholderiales bacterium]|nr:FAD-dependent oxidoreductase [Burkholderiales bacterium]